MATIEDTRRVIESYAAAWQKGDRAATASHYHDDFTLHYFGHNRLSGDHVGKAASLKALAELARRTQWQLLSTEHTLAGPTRGAIVARVRFGAGGATREVFRVLIFRVEERLLRECWAFDQDQHYLDQLIDSGPNA